MSNDKIFNQKKCIKNWKRLMLDADISTVQAFSDFCGVSTNALRNTLSGKSDPTAETIARISEAFGISADYVMGLYDDPLPF